MSNGKVPPLQAAGPKLPHTIAQDFVIEHVELYEQVSIAIVEMATVDLVYFERTVRDLILDTAVSWTQCVCTLQVLIAELETEPAIEAIPGAQSFVAILRHLLDPSAWPFLASSSSPSSSPSSLSNIEEEFQHVVLLPQVDQLERPFGKDRIFLHVFSGRRRPGDLQFYMEARSFLQALRMELLFTLCLWT